MSDVESENTENGERSPAPEIYTRDQHCISRNDIDPDALKIMYRLSRCGYKAYLVGGGVRDLLLGKKPKDYDIATDATPRMVKETFRNSRIIGRRFKLVHVFFGGGKNIQVSTFRDFSDPIDLQDDEEVDTSEQSKAHQTRSDNRYGTEVTDAQRRDLTINGLFYDLSRFAIIDYVGGMKDLQNGIIRVIGDPEERIVEDPVRMIRIVRHAARAGFTIEPNALAAIRKLRSLLKTCSTMRIYEEVRKDLTSGSALSIFRLLAQAELLDLLLPELTANDLVLLSDRSSFPAALRRADSLIRDGESCSSTPVFALIVAYRAYSESNNDPLARFSALEELAGHVEGSLREIAVSRRERERVSELLVSYLKLSRDPQHFRIGPVERHGLVSDLVFFIRAYAPGRSDLLDLLDEKRRSSKQRDSERPGRRYATRGKSRGPRHRSSSSTRGSLQE